LAAGGTVVALLAASSLLLGFWHGIGPFATSRSEHVRYAWVTDQDTVLTLGFYVGCQTLDRLDVSQFPDQIEVSVTMRHQGGPCALVRSLRTATVRLPTPLAGRVIKDRNFSGRRVRLMSGPPLVPRGAELSGRRNLR
jgi:hypothetical protein